MASQKVNIANRIGNFTVMTTSVTTKELYVVMVLKGDEVWDIQPATTPDEAVTYHSQFVTMCQVFDPVMQRTLSDIDAGAPLDREALAEELNRDYRAVIQARKGFVH